jgi:hypothetical protein
MFPLEIDNAKEIDRANAVGAGSKRKNVSCFKGKDFSTAKR